MSIAGSPKRYKNKLALVVFIFFLSPTGFAQSPGPLPVLGQVISPEMRMDGLSVPSGTTLLDATLLETGSYPAVIHLDSALLELAKDSSAYFERLPSGDVRVSVETGSLSFREAGEVLTVFADAELTIPQQTGQPAAAQEKGVVAVLVENAVTGTLTLQVDDVSRIDPSQPILVKSRDSETQEVHYIASIQGTTVVVRAGLTSSFQAQDLIIQGDRAAVAAAGGAPAGTAPAATGLSTTASVASIAAGGGAAAAIAYAVTKEGDKAKSPITP